MSFMKFRYATVDARTLLISKGSKENPIGSLINLKFKEHSSVTRSHLNLCLENDAHPPKAPKGC